MYEVLSKVDKNLTMFTTKMPTTINDSTVDFKHGESDLKKATVFDDLPLH